MISSSNNNNVSTTTTIQTIQLFRNTYLYENMLYVLYQTESKKTFCPRISPEMPIGSLITKYILHFALLCLWNLIIHVKVRPIWPCSSQPHQNKKWIIKFHRHSRAKCKICFVIGEPMCISGEIREQKVLKDAI